MSYAVLALASSAALVAGCGSSSSGGSGGGTTIGGTGTNDSSQSPQQELTSAFSALSKASTLTTTIKLGASADDISALASSEGSTLTSDQANAIAGAQIAIEVAAPSGKTLADLANSSSSGAVDFTVSDNGTNFLTIRSVDKTLYLQADVKDLLDAIGQSATYAQLQAASAQLPAFIQALFNGKWVSIDESAAAGLTGSSGSSASPAQTQAIVAGLKKILADDVTVARASSGSTDQLTLTANSRTLATDFVSTIESAVPTAGAALSSADPSSVPSENITLGAGVTGGALSQLSIDLGQFDPKHKATLPLEINFAQGGSDITAPDGAVKVDTTQLSQLFGSFAGGLGSSG